MTDLLQSVVVAAAIYGLSAEAAFRLRLNAWLGLATGMGMLGVLGFLTFWICFVAPSAAFVLPGAMLIAVLVCIARALIRRSEADAELIPPAVLLCVATMLLMVWTLTGYDGNADTLLRFVADRWTHLPGDNEIPLVFARALAGHAALTHPFYGDWLSSDRPPLQTGLYLLLRDPMRPEVMNYQVCSTALQMLSLCGVWMLTRAMGGSRLWALGAAMIALFLPHVVSTGAYVWPKFLAAAFLSAAVATHFYGPRAERPLLTAAIAGGCAALAMLSHGATAFALLGIGLAALVLRQIGSVRYVVAGAACFLALNAPWTVYQRLLDPPGDRLIKMHIAGIADVDVRPLTEVVSEAYGALTPSIWTDGRVRNAERIVRFPTEAVGDLFQRGNRGPMRTQVFYLVASSFGLLIFVFYASPLFAAWRPTRSVAVATVLTLGVWAVLMFSPDSTTPHQGSYFTMFAVIAMLGRLFSETRWLALGLLLTALHVGFTTWLYWPD